MLPGWEAVIEHEPTPVRCTVTPLMVQLPAAAKPTGNPDEAVALTVKLGSPMVLAASGLNVIGWLACPIVKDCETSAAEWWLASPACEAVMVPKPPLTMWTVLPLAVPPGLVAANDT